MSLGDWTSSPREAKPEMPSGPRVASGNLAPCLARARDSDATPSSKQGRRIWTRELARGGLWERTSRSSTDIYYATPQITACERFTRAARRFTLPPLHSHCLQKRPRTLGFKDDPGASNSKTPYCASAPKTIASMSTSAPRACAGVTNDPKVGLRKEK